MKKNLECLGFRQWRGLCWQGHSDLPWEETKALLKNCMKDGWTLLASTGEPKDDSYRTEEDLHREACWEMERRGEPYAIQLKIETGIETGIIVLLY